MSQTKRWLDVVEDLRHLADSLEFLIAGMKTDEAPVQQPKETKPIKAKETPKVTLEQVRGALASKSQEGKTAEVRELIQKYGASKLSEVDEEHFVDLLKEAGEL
ncbi:rRNA biogenesis protein rrp5 [Streptococcus dysgalactiae]|uniref:rRNA biogenesis protein rrp5 n=1 Tax=Streptococcus dysgalactiae TaxID=1334 RepID=UPI003A6B0790